MSAKVYINMCSETELRTIPGVGPRLARKIWQLRQNLGVLRRDDILYLSGLRNPQEALMHISFQVPGAGSAVFHEGEGNVIPLPHGIANDQIIPGSSPSRDELCERAIPVGQLGSQPRSDAQCLDSNLKLLDQAQANLAAKRKSQSPAESETIFDLWLAASAQFGKEMAVFDEMLRSNRSQSTRDKRRSTVSAPPSNKEVKGADRRGNRTESLVIPHTGENGSRVLNRSGINSEQVSENSKLSSHQRDHTRGAHTPITPGPVTVKEQPNSSLEEEAWSEDDSHLRRERDGGSTRKHPVVLPSSTPKILRDNPPCDERAVPRPEYSRSSTQAHYGDINRREQIPVDPWVYSTPDRIPGFSMDYHQRRYPDYYIPAQDQHVYPGTDAAPVGYGDRQPLVVRPPLEPVQGQDELELRAARYHPEQYRDQRRVPERQGRRREHEESDSDGSIAPRERRHRRHCSKSPNLPRTLTYDGTSKWSAFYVKFQRFARSQQWNEDKKMDKLCFCLSGKAGDYFALLLERDEDISFASLVRKFEKRFGLKDLPETAQVQFANMKQASGESLEEWAERVLSVAVVAFGDLQDDFVEKQVVRRFCQGCLNKDTAQYASNLEIRTLEKAIDAVRHFQHTLEAIYGKSRKEIRQVRLDSSSDDEPVTISQLSRRVKKAPSSQATKTQSTQVNKPSSNDPSVLDRLSRLESRVEEMAADIRKLTLILSRRARSPPTSPNRSTDNCYNCGKSGHYSRNFRSPPASPKK